MLKIDKTFQERIKKMSKAIIQAKFGGKRIAHGYFKHGKPSKKLLALVASLKSEKNNTAVQMKEQQTR